MKKSTHSSNAQNDTIKKFENCSLKDLKSIKGGGDIVIVELTET